MPTARLCALLVLVAGCGGVHAPATSSDGGDGGDGGSVPAQVSAYDISFASIFDALPSGDAQLATVCARGHGDLITTRMCATPTPTLRVFSDLQHLLDLDFT